MARGYRSRKRRAVNNSRRFERITFNLFGTKARMDVLEGRDHLVVPCVMITEGVHNGNRGPGLYRESEIEPTVFDWNGMPVVSGHPKKSSARSAKVLNKIGLGTVLNTVWDSPELGSELWLDVKRTNAVDDRIIPAIKKKKKLEVSTGLYLNRFKKSGTFKGEKYTWIATNQKPDHLAILLDGVGACSVKKGCGIQLNSGKTMKCKGCKVTNRFFSAKRRKVLAKKGNALPDGSFPISNPQDLHNAIQAFGRAKDKAAAKRHIIKMAKRMGMTGSLPQDWKMARNSASKSLTWADPALSIRELVMLQKHKEIGMLSTKRKARMVRQLIANSDTWTMKDKKDLLSMKDSAFKKIYNSALEPDDEGGILDRKKKVKKKVVKNSRRDRDDDDRPRKKKKKIGSANSDWKKQLPADVLAVINQGQKAIQRRKGALVEIIINNENNVFAEKWLLNQEPDVLEGIAALAAAPEDDQDDDGMFQKGFRPDYSGAIGASVANRRGKDDDDSDDDDDLLELPELYPVKNQKNDDDDDDEDDNDSKNRDKKKKNRSRE